VADVATDGEADKRMGVADVATDGEADKRMGAADEEADKRMMVADGKVEHIFIIPRTCLIIVGCFALGIKKSFGAFTLCVL
ncbi:MAG: hypothetical protein DDG60_01620, partial [Anaerolineae bacterium]